MTDGAEQLMELFDEHAVDVAPHLLDCQLTVTTAEGAVTVRITEVEAYGDQGEDPGAHSFRGPTQRNATLFGPPRHAYVYQSYGIHYCLNLTTYAAGAGGVLLRAGEVIGGRDLAVQRRGGKDTGAKLLAGPGRLGQGFGVRLSMDGSELRTVGDPQLQSSTQQLSAQEEAAFVLRGPSSRSGPVGSGPRVGVSGEGGSGRFPWRFWIEGDPSVSAYRASRPRGTGGEKR